MTVQTRQERDFAHYRSEARECVRCGGAYGAGTYREHRRSGQHERYLVAREQIPGLREAGDAYVTEELCSELLGRPSLSMPASELVALLEG